MVVNVGNSHQNHGLAQQNKCFKWQFQLPSHLSTAKTNFVIVVGKMHEKKLGPVLAPQALRAQNSSHFLCFVLE